MGDDNETTLPDRTQPDESSTAPADGSTPLVRGSVLAGRYAIERVLGRGGMGIVLRAYDHVLDEVVAIKVLAPERARERRWVERLAREVKLARQINHANVCRVFDFGEADGHVFFVMELAVGGSLRGEIDAGRVPSRPIDGRMRDVRAIAEGLAAIHEAGIVHRDVTPQNVLRMADGRLVVSDFGLATDADLTLTSVHGGTVAYMAPEVANGRPADFQADVWALGVVLHEAMFGIRPVMANSRPWPRQATGLRERLAPEERFVLEVCRECTRQDRRRRPARASDVVLWLRTLRSPGARPLRVAAATALLVTGLAAVGATAAWRHVNKRSPGPPPGGSVGKIVPTGEPSDWTDAAKAIARYPGRVRCLVALPGRESVRVVWGSPPVAEDVDVRTGKRQPSQLVEAAYREGCPDLSPDGRRLVYSGYVDDGRVFAFVSPHGDGSDAVPLFPIDDPTVSSDPKWLPTGDAFLYDADPKHVGVYSLVTKRSTILSDPTHEPFATVFRFVVGSEILLSASLTGQSATEFVMLSWPRLTEKRRFRLADHYLDVVSPDGKTFYASSLRAAHVVQVEPDAQSGRVLGRLGERNFVRYLAGMREGLALASFQASGDVWAREAGGQYVRLTWDGNFESACPCGTELLAAQRTPGGSHVIRLDERGRAIAALTPGVEQGSPACNKDGSLKFFATWAGSLGIHRCEHGTCERISSELATGLDVSPDGRRLVYMTAGPRGLRVRWISTSGGEGHDLADSDTGCAAAWSSSETVWLSKRRGRRILWNEVQVDTSQETGRSKEGVADCLRGDSDPGAPIRHRIEAVIQRVSELRFIPFDGIRDPAGIANPVRPPAIHAD